MLKTVYEIAEKVRKEVEGNYGDFLNGKCIEASDRISLLLKEKNIPHKIVEGWCVYDDFISCTDRPYDEHTWIELIDEDKTYIDVTATQFASFIDEEIPEIIVGKRPYYMQHNEPDEEQLEEIGGNYKF